MSLSDNLKAAAVSERALNPKPEKEFKKFMFDQVFVSGQPRTQPKALEHTEDDLVKTRSASDLAGYQRGVAETQIGLLQQSGQEISRRLEEFSQMLIRQEELLHQQVANLTQQVLETFLPAYAQNHGFEEIKKVIDQVYATREHQKITLFVHPAQVDSLKIYLKEFIEKNILNTTLTLQAISGEDEFGFSDCRIEWNGGGMERREKRLQDEIILALKRLENWHPAQKTVHFQDDLENRPEDATEFLPLKTAVGA